MTILRTLLGRGYFPKELPPSFYTEQFAAYASTTAGKALIEAYRPADAFTECVRYSLALPGLQRRQIAIIHPVSFTLLAALTSKNFTRLLRKAGNSPFSKSRPVFETGKPRALRPLFKPANLARERMLARAGAKFVLKVDVSQFYPALYTHAVGWAIDKKLRHRKHWRNNRLLGKQVDQAFMDLQRKVSQGIPIGNDVSFLMGEVVLAQVDAALNIDPRRCYRWFDDYEIGCENIEEAESALAAITAGLRSFGLRVNARKTKIVALPTEAQESWQTYVFEAAQRRLDRLDGMLTLFDRAFQMRDKYNDSAVLAYALGLLFKVRCPDERVRDLAQSGVSQAILAEPGVAQKAVALLNFWGENGCPLDVALWSQTFTRLVASHRAGGVSSDVSWALFFCIQRGIRLGKSAARALSECDDDSVLLQSLHAHNDGLLRVGFSVKRVSKLVRSVNLDGEHWLLGYESLRQGFLTDSAALVAANPLFADLLARGVTFYRRQLPTYAAVIHLGGAPEWIVRAWIDQLLGRATDAQRHSAPIEGLPVVTKLAEDVVRLAQRPATAAEAIADLLEVFEPEAFEKRVEPAELYWG